MLAPNPVSFAALMSWLRAQDPSTEYEWASCCDCLVGRYLSENNIDRVAVSRFSELFDGDHDAYMAIARGNNFKTGHTYGEALARAEAWLNK